MKRRRLFSVALLMFLYMGTGIFCVVSAEPNIVKDFTPAIEYEIHDQSILGFEETLPNEVVYYPDSLLSPPYLASGGDTGYNNTYAVDGIFFHPIDGDEILEFEYSNINQIEYFEYSVYGKSSDYVALYYSDDNTSWSEWFVLVDEPTLEWYNGTEYNMAPLGGIDVLPNTGTLYVYFDFNSYIDYIDISFGYMTLSSETDILTTPQFAYNGSFEYENTYAVDDVFFEPFYGTETLEFEYDLSRPIEYFNYSVYGNSTDYVALYYSDDGTSWSEWFVLVDEPTLEWYNGTENDVSVLSNIEMSGSFYIYFDFRSWIDYIDISFCYAVSLGENSYAESFANVSEWVFDVASGVYSFGSDGDVSTLTTTCVGTGNDYVRYEQYGLNIPVDSYVEIRFKTTDAYLGVQFYDGDIETPTPVNEVSSADYTTIKFFLSTYVDAPVTGIELQINDYSNSKASGSIFGYFDYLRIGPSNELGYQHDGSTLAGYNDASGGTSTTDGDKVTLTADGDGSVWYIFIDSTTTGAYLDLDHYPFFEISITAGSGDWTLKQYDGAYDVIQASSAITTGIQRFNARAISDTSKEIRIDMSANSVLTFDYMGYYSIANFSITQGATEITDVMYVNVDGHMVYERTTNVYLTIYDDYAIAINTATSPTLNISTYDVDYTDTTKDWAFYLYGETAPRWRYDYHVTAEDGYRYTLNGGTAIGLQFVNYEDMTLISIEYWTDPPQYRTVGVAEIMFDTPEWNGVIAIIRFVVELSTITLTTSLTFAGLVLIPGSTLYLAYNIKHRDEMSVEKFLAFLLAFFCGWALFLGGIL